MSSRSENLIAVLKKYLPEGVEDYCHEILWQYGIQLHIKKPRKTKLGDYRPPRNGEAHRISVNNDLNQYAFLLTFLHETAHLINFEKRGYKVQPHGKEWKQEFQLISDPVIEKSIFPKDVFSALRNYLNNPGASSCSDANLIRVLKRYDKNSQHLIFVESVQNGSKFQTSDGRIFIKGEKLRSRYKCIEVLTGKFYFVPGLMEVEPYL